MRHLILLVVATIVLANWWINKSPARHVPAQWLTLIKTSVGDIPDQPSQVFVTITTGDGKHWEAQWQEREKSALYPK